jgi:hypothetical protein
MVTFCDEFEVPRKEVAHLCRNNVIPGMRRVRVLGKQSGRNVPEVSGNECSFSLLAHANVADANAKARGD